MASHVLDVLLVDHELECRSKTSKLLQMSGYKVTELEFAASAIQLLVAKIYKFDIVLANVNSPDRSAFELLQYAHSIDLPVIFLCVAGHTNVAMKSLNDGATLYANKPVSIEIVGWIWQHVAKKKLTNTTTTNAAVNQNVRGIQIRENIYSVEEKSNCIAGNHGGIAKDKGKQVKSTTGPDNMDGSGVANYEYEISGGRGLQRKTKRRTLWKDELHEKFLDAIRQLGHQRCVPRHVHELMNVPNLTRTQVASHLQNWRNCSFGSPKVRQAKRSRMTSNGSYVPKGEEFGSLNQLGNVTSNGIGKVGQSSQSYYQTDNNMQGDTSMNQPGITSHPIKLKDMLCQSIPTNTVESSPNWMAPDDYSKVIPRSFQSCYETGNMQGDTLMDQIMTITSEPQTSKSIIPNSHPTNIASSSSNCMDLDDDFFDFSRVDPMFWNVFNMPEGNETNNIDAPPVSSDGA